MNLVEEVNRIWNDMHLRCGITKTKGAPRVEITNRLRTTAGKASPSQHMVLFNLHMLLLEPNYHETIVHEVAHIFACYYLRSRGHDKPWRNVMIRMGLEPKRCHEYASSKRNARVTLKCPHCNRSVVMTTNKLTRMKNGRVYRHVPCGGLLSAPTPTNKNCEASLTLAVPTV
jgi:predicted SprT family Zn-dependent metalloprotease